MLVVELIVVHILARPTRPPPVSSGAVAPSHSGSTGGDPSSTYSKATVYSRTNRLISSVANSLRPRRVGIEGVAATQRGRASIANGLELTPRDELIVMLSQLETYRASLADRERTEFDLAWGIDANAAMNLLQHQNFATLSSNSKKSIVGPLLADIRNVREKTNKEIRLMSKLSEENRGRRLLLLFQQDLLVGVTGKIAERKGEHHSDDTKEISPLLKLCAWVFLIAFNAALIFYVFLFAVNQSPERQEEIAEDGEVTKLKDAVPNSFNACTYLFVSHRVAATFPALIESKIVSNFCTSLPRQSYRHMTSVSASYRAKLRLTAFTNSVAVLMIFFLGVLMKFPPAVENLVYNLLTWVLLGIMSMVNVLIFEKCSPSLQVLSVICSVVFIVAMLWSVSFLRSTDAFPDEIDSGK
ncbi:unnamed protein product, partial [Symbiodinium microadriaticum]